MVRVWKKVRRWKKILFKIASGEIALGPFSYAQHGLYTRRNADFMNDEKFSGALSKAAELTAWKFPGPYRPYINCWAATHAMRLDGDFVECGVWKGFTSRTVIEYTDFRNSHKKFYLVDSYEGFREGDVTPEEIKLGIKTHEKYKGTYEDACRVFSDINNAVLVKGYVPEVLNCVAWRKISYLHIAMDHVYPEIAAADFFWDKMIMGGIMILDGYGRKRRILQKRAFDDFARKHGVEVLTLPTGQGLILRP